MVFLGCWGGWRLCPRNQEAGQDTKKPRNQQTKKLRNRTTNQETKKPRNQETGQWTRNAHVETFHAECFDSYKFAEPALKLKEFEAVTQFAENPKHAR